MFHSSILFLKRKTNIRNYSLSGQWAATESKTPTQAHNWRSRLYTHSGASSFLPTHWLTDPVNYITCNLEPKSVEAGCILPNNMWKTLHLKFSTSLTFCSALRSVGGRFPLSEPAGQVDRLCQHDEPWFSGGDNRWKQIFGVAVCEKHLLSCHDKLSTRRSSFISMVPTTPNHHNYRHMGRLGC